MKRFCRIAALCGSSILIPATLALAQQNFCAGCHFANPDAPAGWHVANWDRSLHGSRNVGCERCHRGNANTGESHQAHQGVLNSGIPTSPVNGRNLAATCGSCHTGQFVEFQKSRHSNLVNAGQPGAPNCNTCHGDVGEQLPSPKAVEGQCAACHGAGKRVPRPGYAMQARLLFEGISEARGLLRTAKTVIARVNDRQLRARYERAYEQAEVPLIQAVHAAHSFVFDDSLKERLLLSRQRIDALLTQLANPPHG
jgi:Cytochrome c7 and related cytochrome c/Cytochrome c554 and c-prime